MLRCVLGDSLSFHSVLLGLEGDSSISLGFISEVKSITPTDSTEICLQDAADGANSSGPMHF